MEFYLTLQGLADLFLGVWAVSLRVSSFHHISSIVWKMLGYLFETTASYGFIYFAK